MTRNLDVVAWKSHAAIFESGILVTRNDTTKLEKVTARTPEGIILMH